jgi:hypothetical protein
MSMAMSDGYRRIIEVANERGHFPFEAQAKKIHAIAEKRKRVGMSAKEIEALWLRVLEEVMYGVTTNK